ncbi:uncharacterized protein [Aristolochia californica]|uniref:uncharacterized protein n=1 Tax=Aristolochia californica TaxID=171875 RepID=UPI0035D54FF6
MRCKSHPYEGGVGVCASCLRERLLALVAAQEREAESPDNRRKSETHPPPLVFPRSVSPYVSRRSAAREAWHHHPRFYSTPQVGPSCRDNKNGRFSLISSIFRSRSHEKDSDPRVSDASAKVSSSSWISNLFPGRRKKKSRLFSLDEESSTTGGCQMKCRTRNRGMSPVSKRRDEGSESPAGSGYSSESSTGYRKQITGPPRRRATPQHTRNVSGFAFCLSPLVRASPNASRVDAGFSGEIRSANRFHLSTAASLGANRSRKLADFGRYP